MQDEHQRLSGSNYLRDECLKKQREVAKALFNQDQDLRKIEELAADIRLSSNLTCENVRKITDAGLWSGRGFWQWPTAEEFNDRLKQHPVGDLSTELRERGEQHVVGQLLGVFRHIEPVSVVMRFVKPDDYGILSYPVEKILEVSPSRQPRNKYLAGRIAGIELERAIKVWAMKDGRGFAEGRRWDLRDAVNCLPVPSRELSQWHDAVDLRNRAVHPFDNNALKLKEANYLLDYMREAIARETTRSG